MKTGWVSPDGDFIQCSAYEHIQTARDLCRQLGYHSTIENNVPDDELLMQHGWAYVGKSELDFNYRVGWHNFLTESQKNTLKPYFDGTLPMDRFCQARFDSEL